MSKGIPGFGEDAEAGFALTMGSVLGLRWFWLESPRFYTESPVVADGYPPPWGGNPPRLKGSTDYEYQDGVIEARCNDAPLVRAARTVMQPPQFPSAAAAGYSTGAWSGATSGGAGGGVGSSTAIGGAGGGVGSYHDFAGHEVPHPPCGCVSPETRVLTADLRWVPAGDLEVGEALLAFDEYPADRGYGRAAGRKYRAAVVACTDRGLLPCYDLEFDDGSIVRVSADHRWLVYNQAKAARWVRTDELRAGQLRASHIVKPFTPWDTDISREAGYLAAAFDGEGSLSQGRKRHQYRLGFAQAHNPMLAETERCLKELGFTVRVVDKTYIGEREVVKLGTTTGTYFAEGMASHNCGFWAFWTPEAAGKHPTGSVNLPVLGVVEGTGRVIHGERGFRAQKCRIVALHCPVKIGARPATARRLSERATKLRDQRLNVWNDLKDLVSLSRDGGSSPQYARFTELTKELERLDAQIAEAEKPDKDREARYAQTAADWSLSWQAAIEYTLERHYPSARIYSNPEAMLKIHPPGKGYLSE